MPAAGRGRRLGGRGPKALVELAGRPLFWHALSALLASARVEGAVVAAPEEALAAFRGALSGHPREGAVRWAAGGPDRQESVRRALERVPAGARVVLVHDAARPFLPEAVLARVIEAGLSSGAAAAALPPADTVVRAGPAPEGADGSAPGAVGEAGAVRPLLGLLDRRELALVQTPQAFSAPLFRAAHKWARRSGRRFTDDLTLVAGYLAAVREGGDAPPPDPHAAPCLVPGDPRLRKVTTPDDLAWARAELASGAPEFRVGVGVDFHRFTEGRPLVLGGVRIPYEKGLLGHSDADVLAHAIADALLGAASLGDIGLHFPPGDPRYAGAASLALLGEVARLVRGAGWSPVNVDAAVVAEAPCLAPHVPRMRERLAAAIGLPEEAVSVKATTPEGLGALGRGEGIAAQAVAAVCRATRGTVAP